MTAKRAKKATRRRIRITVISNAAGGMAEEKMVTGGTTVAELMELEVPGRDAASFQIRVNREIATADQVLKAGDAVTITPTKVKGN